MRCRIGYILSILWCALVHDPLCASLSEIVEKAPHKQAGLRVEILETATYQGLNKRTLMMIRVTNEASETFIKPFYRSSGLNSGSTDTSFPFENISGRFLEKRFTQVYVEKTHGTHKEVLAFRHFFENDELGLADRFAKIEYARVSAILGQGFWKTQEGESVAKEIDAQGVLVPSYTPSKHFRTAAEVRAWMRSFGYEIKPGVVFGNQLKYAQFSYEVLMTLAHRLCGGEERHALDETYRGLCLKIHTLVRPGAMALLVPGFQERESLNDFSQYVDKCFSKNEYRLTSMGFLPISINYYSQNKAIDAITLDLDVLRQFKWVKENKFSYVAIEPILVMNKWIDRFMEAKRVRKFPKLRDFKSVNKVLSTKSWDSMSNFSKHEGFFTPVLRRAGSLIVEFSTVSMEG